MGKNNAGRGFIGLTPVIVFLLLYVVVSLVAGDFYAMPFSVALLVASAWAVVITPGPIAARLDTYSKAAGHSNIIYMIWIFILAGAFASLAKEIGAVEATVDLTLRYLPAGFVVPGLFAAACFISLAVGTSVGTVVALAPLAADIAAATAGNAAFFVAVVLGGAFFGDNLSFISDTTIAATRSQGCEMQDKFKANLKIALPAAVLTLLVYVYQAGEVPALATRPEAPSAWLVLPYLIVIATAVMRWNVALVLVLGIVSAFIIGLMMGTLPLTLCGYMGTGIESMGSLIVVTLMSAGMLGLVKACGGIDWLLSVLTRRINGMRGAEGCVAVLVGLVNMCTANNTVAIITVGHLSREIANRYGIAPRKCASLLDTCSCIVQCLIPYGAQTLLACSLTGLSPADPFPYLYYPWALALAVFVSVIITGKVGSSAKKG